MLFGKAEPMKIELSSIQQLKARNKELTKFKVKIEKASAKGKVMAEKLLALTKAGDDLNNNLYEMGLQVETATADAEKTLSVFAKQAEALGVKPSSIPEYADLDVNIAKMSSLHKESLQAMEGLSYRRY
mgnify:CR=1 FL=1